MANSTSPETASADVTETVVPDSALTSHGFTVGELIENARTEIQIFRDETEKTQHQLKAKIDELTAATQEITRLTAELEATKKRPQFTDEEIAKAITTIKPERGIRKLPDGTVIVQVRVNVDSAVQLLSWAESAGEDPTTYIQKAVDEGLLLYTSQ